MILPHYTTLQQSGANHEQSHDIIRSMWTVIYTSEQAKFVRFLLPIVQMLKVQRLTALSKLHLHSNCFKNGRNAVVLSYCTQV